MLSGFWRDPGAVVQVGTIFESRSIFFWVFGSCVRVAWQTNTKFPSPAALVCVAPLFLDGLVRCSGGFLYHSVFW